MAYASPQLPTLLAEAEGLLQAIWGRKEEENLSFNDVLKLMEVDLLKKFTIADVLKHTKLGDVRQIIRRLLSFGQKRLADLNFALNRRYRATEAALKDRDRYETERTMLTSFLDELKTCIESADSSRR